MTGERIRVTPGFLLLLAVLFYLDRDVGILPRGMAAAVLHECGHYGLGRAFGGRLQCLELSAVGARMDLRYPSGLSYGRETAVALAGPAVNLLAAWAALGSGWHLFALISLAVGGFNLLPILPLDGGRALQCTLSALWGEERAEGILPVVAALPVGVLTGLGLFAAVHFANVSLLVTALWLLWLTLNRKNRKK